MHFLAVSSFLIAGLGAASGTSIPKTTLVARGSPKGINNRGSSECNGDNVQEIADYIANVPDTQLYDGGFHIACTGNKGRWLGAGGHCAFLQGTSQPVDGRQVKALIKMLNDKSDVKSCGSVPVSLLPEYGGINELAKMGMLTVNYVSDTDNPCPPGVCGATAAPPEDNPTDLSTCPDPDAPAKRDVTAPTDLDLTNLGAVRKASPSHLQKRVDLNPSTAAEYFDMITTAGGVQMVVADIQEFEPTGGLCPLVGAFFTELVPTLAEALQVNGPADGQLATAQHGRYNLAATLDTTASDNVAGALTPSDLDKLIGAMAHRMARDKLQGVQLKLRTIAGAAAITIALAVFVG